MMQRSRSISDDSDDSGIDDELANDEFLQARIEKMRNLSKETKNTTTFGGDRIGSGSTHQTSQSSYSMKNKYQDNVDIGDRLNALRVDESRTLNAQRYAGINNDFDYGSEEDDTYELEWITGPLKMEFKMDRHGQIVIRKVSRKGSAVKGVQMARAGDVLQYINGISVQGVAFSEVVERLRSPPLPLTLTFQPPRLDDEERIGKDLSESGMSGQSTQTSNHDRQSSSAMSHDSSSTHDRLTNDYFRESLPRYSSTPNSIIADNTPPGPDEYDVIWTDGSLGCGLRQCDGLTVVKSTATSAVVDESVKQINVGDTMILINNMWCEIIGFKAVVETMQNAPKPIYLRFRRRESDSSHLSHYMVDDFPSSMMNDRVVSSAGSRPQTNKVVEGSDRNFSDVQSPYPPENRPLSRFPAPIEVLRDSQVTTSNSGFVLGPNQYTVLWKDGPLGIQIKGKVHNNTTIVVVTKFTGTGNPALCSQIAIGDVFVRVAGVDVSSVGLSGTFELLRTVKKPVVLVFERADSMDDPAGVKDIKRSESIVPSFRLMRERQANAAAVPPIGTRTQSESSSDHGRQGFSRFSPKPREVVGDSFSGRGSEATSQHTDHSSASGDKYTNVPPSSTPFYPGRDDVDQPPPPSYAELFTESGQLKDENVLDRHSSASQVTAGPSVSQIGLRRMHSSGIPPPSYNLKTTRSSDGRDSEDNAPYDRLRQQYVEAERRRNQQVHELSTQYSSYSDLDDSGTLVPRIVPPTDSLPSSPKEQSNHTWIHWAEGPLGITFRRTDNQIVVSRLTGAGFSPGLDQLKSGDWLISFGNERAGVTYLTKDLRLSETMELIKKLPKPVDMCFIVQ